MVNIKNRLRNPLGSTAGIFCLKGFAISSFLLLTISIKAQATLEVSDAKKNFGFVKRGELIKNEFEIVNTGNQPLIINEAEVSCSCTTVDFPKEPILPGQKAKIVVNFNTTTVYGRQDRIVYLHSNDPKGPSRLRYKGIVSNK